MLGSLRRGASGEPPHRGVHRAQLVRSSDRGEGGGQAGGGYTVWLLPKFSPPRGERGPWGQQLRGAAMDEESAAGLVLGGQVAGQVVCPWRQLGPTNLELLPAEALRPAVLCCSIRLPQKPHQS